MELRSPFTQTADGTVTLLKPNTSCQGSNTHVFYPHTEDLLYVYCSDGDDSVQALHGLRFLNLTDCISSADATITGKGEVYLFVSGSTAYCSSNALHMYDFFKSEHSDPEFIHQLSDYLTRDIRDTSLNEKEG